MKRNTNEIKRLKIENDFLKKGIKNREDAYESIFNEKETQVKLLKELAYMLLHMEVIEDLVKNDHNHTSMIVKKAFAELKQRLVNGFYADGKMTKTNDTSHDE
ncbi:hypothetical protein [Prevotella sp. P6B4]|uniref:hypothetical protein n=1 Tax=Prevotella sp. P6B4 TaxID=1410614 RepID=UPI00048B1ED1|nr:hypothetical protein [Prevotella sp. P6B4]